MGGLFLTPEDNLGFWVNLAVEREIVKTGFLAEEVFWGEEFEG
jgi:hypothetical protein